MKHTVQLASHRLGGPLLRSLNPRAILSFIGNETHFSQFSHGWFSLHSLLKCRSTVSNSCITFLLQSLSVLEIKGSNVFPTAMGLMLQTMSPCHSSI